MGHTKVVEIAGTHIHQELAELAELPGFHLVSMAVSEWTQYRDPITRFIPVRWLVVYMEGQAALPTTAYEATGQNANR